MPVSEFWRDFYDGDDLAEQREQFGIEYEDYAYDRDVHPSGNPLTLGDGTPWPEALDYDDEEETPDLEKS